MTGERRADLSAMRRLRSRACSTSTALTTSTAHSRVRQQHDRRPRQGRSSVADPPTELDELVPMVSEQRRIGLAARIRVDTAQPVLGRNVAADQILQRATTGRVEGMQDYPSDSV